MSCIHFKFKSSLDYEKLTFDGLHISLSDLKEAIMKQKKIGSVNQYTLSVKDAQSKKGEKMNYCGFWSRCGGFCCFGVWGGGGKQYQQFWKSRELFLGGQHDVQCRYLKS